MTVFKELKDKDMVAIRVENFGAQELALIGQAALVPLSPEERTDVLTQALDDATIVPAETAAPDDEVLARQMAAGCVEVLRKYTKGEQADEPTGFYFHIEDLLHLMAHKYFLEQAAHLPGAMPLNRVELTLNTSGQDESQPVPLPVLSIGDTVLSARVMRHSTDFATTVHTGEAFAVTYSVTKNQAA